MVSPMRRYRRGCGFTHEEIQRRVWFLHPGGDTEEGVVSPMPVTWVTRRQLWSEAGMVSPMSVTRGDTEEGVVSPMSVTGGDTEAGVM